MTKIIGFGYNNNVLLFLRAFMLISKGLPMKEKFYKTYQNSSIEIPTTYYFDCSKEKKFNKKMNYPVETPERSSPANFSPVRSILNFWSPEM